MCKGVHQKIKLLFEHKTLGPSFFSFRLSFKMAASSINVNLSATLEFSLSFSVLLPSGQIVEVAGSSDTMLIPSLSTENSVLTEPEPEPSTTNVEEILESMTNDDPIPCSSGNLIPEAESVKGPLTAEMMRSLKAKFESIINSSPSSLLLMPTAGSPMPTAELPMPTAKSAMPTAGSPMPRTESLMSTIDLPMPTAEFRMPTAELPMLTAELSMPTVESPMSTTVLPSLDSLPMCPLTLTFPSSSAFVNVDSPASPSFLSIDPNDLFWIPLPCLEENFERSIIESVVEKEGELVVEVDLDKMDDEEIVFLGEFKKV